MAERDRFVAYRFPHCKMKYQMSGISVSPNVFRAAVDWCFAEFGDDEDMWWSAEYYIHIQNDDHAMHFKLRWC